MHTLITENLVLPQGKIDYSEPHPLLPNVQGKHGPKNRAFPFVHPPANTPLGIWPQWDPSHSLPERSQLRRSAFFSPACNI
jgi:hypothetical protein